MLHALQYCFKLCYLSTYRAMEAMLGCTRAEFYRMWNDLWQALNCWGFGYEAPGTYHELPPISLLMANVPAMMLIT